MHKALHQECQLFNISIVRVIKVLDAYGHLKFCSLKLNSIFLGKYGPPTSLP